jgi:outer membrane protein assembly factor BamE
MRPAIVILTALALSQTACISLYVPGVRQGNLVTTETIQEVKIGMTRNQVRFVLGTPLISDPFHKDRWDYYYRFKANSEKGTNIREHVIIHFEGDKVARIEQTGVPSEKTVLTDKG